MKENNPVYLDYAATTPIDARVVEGMAPYFSQFFGNPSSIHTYGQQAEAALEAARESVAADLHCQADEIVFTSGGTESDNLALRGMAIAESERRQARHLLITPVEHHAVSHTALQLAEHFGFEVEFLPVDAYGMVDPHDVERRIRKETALVSVIFGNNEIGTLNPIAEIGAVCRQQGIPFHTDAVQAAAHLEINLQHMNIDLLSLGGHKFYGPKGVGVLYVRKGLKLLPTQTGGGQEAGLRSGTQNVPYIAGLAAALHLACEERPFDSARLLEMRDWIIGQVLENVPQSRLTGHPVKRLSNHASFVFEGVNGNDLLMLLDAAGFACSSGSACKTGSPKASEVLLAIGIEPDWALGSLRVTLGRGVTPEMIAAFLDQLPGLIEKSRKLSSVGSVRR